MAREVNITATNAWFLGEDKIFEFEIFGPDGKTPVDVSSWGMEFVLRKKDSSPDPAILKKTTTDLEGAIVIVGVFNVDPTVNTQRVQVPFSADTDYAALQAIAYRHSLKRTDDGSMAVLAYGTLTFLQATSR